jgi:hypothetical protein
VELKCLEVKEAQKTLGVKTAPTGDNTSQFEHTLEASHKWAAQIKANNLRQMDAWLALHSTCTTLSEKQREQITRLAMSAGLTNTRGSRSIGRRIASPPYSPRYCTSEHSSVS